MRNDNRQPREEEAPKNYAAGRRAALELLKDASSRFDWKAWRDMKAASFKIRVGQQKQKKAK